MVRRPVVAGSFYPADPDELRDTIDVYLQNARIDDMEENLLGLIAPHAGYPYSGQTAAHAFKTLKDKDIKNVILLGPSHRAFIEGFSVYESGSWETPLGKVEINDGLAEKIKSHSDLITFQPEAHEREHSIEVQLPFLQSVMQDFTIVPIVLVNDNIEKLEILSEALYSELKNESSWIIISSTDLYHGYNYTEAEEVTDRVNEYILNLNYKKLLKYDREKRASGESAACGISGAVTMMMTAEKFNATKGVLLHRTNSGDVTGQKSGYIVGYGAWAITGDDNG